MNNLTNGLRRAVSVTGFAIIGVGIANGVVACSGSSSTPPAATDVQAARACQTFVQLASGKATGQNLIDAAQPLLAGTAQAQANGQASPKWSSLGADLISAASDPASADGIKLAGECGSIPDAAKRAGGYTR